MREFHKQINDEFQSWKNTPPNIIQRGLGVVGKPLNFILEPIIKKITPLLEGILKKSNSFIADSLNSVSVESVDIHSLNENQFKSWLTERDSSAQKWLIGGVAALSAEGGAGGFLGFTAVAIEIPTSFATLITFANKIALTYALDITDEKLQMEILKAITAGSATNIDSKIEAIGTFTFAAALVSKTTWKAMSQMSPQSIGGSIHAIRALLHKLGINVTKRKATQLIPGIGALTGLTINASWATDSLNAVKQYSRYIIVNSYYSKNGA